MSNIFALIFTLIIGLFMLLGSLIVFLTDNKDKFVNFAISMSFTIMIFLLALDLIPEAYHLIANKSPIITSLFLLGLILIGGGILKALDHFIPHHHDDHCHDEHALESHLHHIGLVSTIAIALHNIIEGMAVFGTIASSIQSGFLICVGISFHNIPLGMAITSTIYKSNHSVKKTLLYVFLISISTFVGGLLMLPLSMTSYGSTILMLLLGITIGMLLYIVIFELLPTVVDNKEKKETWYGIIVGIILMLLSTLIG